MAEKSCVICGGDESDSGPLVEAPCATHWVCHDDVSSFFERAAENESLFPPKCCGQMFLLKDYEQYVNFDVAWAYQVKEQGEYAVLAKFRIYCSNGSCAKFLHASSHVKDEATKITYAVCEDAACGKMTCTGCRVQLKDGTQNHVCTNNDDDEQFKRIARENGYQECAVCGATVELIEACNHITCECGHDFCYVCGIDWDGLHGCPHYGKPEYDDEGYNQDGFHHRTGMNHDGLTRTQEIARRLGEDPDAENDEDGEEEDVDWEVLNHLTPDQRIMINSLDNAARADALDQLRIELFEQEGIMFGQDAENHAPRPFEPYFLIQQLLQPTLAAFVARAPADEDGAFELLQDTIAEIPSGLAAWALQELDASFDAAENPGIEDENMQTLAEHFTREPEILALEMDPDLLVRLGVHVADQLVQQASRFDDDEGEDDNNYNNNEEQDANVNAQAHSLNDDGAMAHQAQHSAAPQQDANTPTTPAHFTNAQINDFLQQSTRADLTIPFSQTDLPTAVNNAIHAYTTNAPPSPTEPEESTDPSTPAYQYSSEDGTHTLWGPPGGWPEEEGEGEEELW